jgi:amino acid permease
LNVSSYAELVETSFGKFAKKLFEIDLILFCFGTIVCFQIIFAQFLWEAFVAFGVNEERETILKMIF